MSLYDVYVRDVLLTQPPLHEMSRAGVPFSEERRHEYAYKLAARLEAVVTEMREIVPSEVCQPDVLTKPRSTEGLEEFEAVEAVPVCPGCHALVPSMKHKQHFRILKKKPNPCGGLAPVMAPRTVKRWLRRNPFVPSMKQILAYQDYFNHRKVYRKDKKTGLIRPTTDETAIQTLVLRYKDDKLYPLVLKYRQLDKLAGTYLGRPDPTCTGVVGGLRAGRDGMLHTRFTFNPSTGRLASEDPNLQNIPRPSSEEASWVKKCFVAPPGFLYWSLDYKGIEAVLVGYFAGSRNYIRLSQIDVHTFFTVHAEHLINKTVPASDLPDLDWDDTQLAGYLSEMRKKFKSQRQMNKHLVHGGAYLMTPFKAQEVLLKELGMIIEVKQLKQLFGVFFDLFPEIRDWQINLCKRVDSTRRQDPDRNVFGFKPEGVDPIDTGTCFIRSPFGWVHRFYQPLRWFSKVVDGSAVWTWEFGEDAKRIAAFLPQHSAAEIIKAAGRRLYYELPLVGQYMRLWVHDDITGFAPEDRVMDVLREAKAEMEKPVPELPLPPQWGLGEHLRIYTEAKVGPSWGEMREVLL